MAISETNKLLAKKHLGYDPNDTTLDKYFTALEDSGVKESQFNTAVSDCETLLTAVKAVRTATDELTEGGGARFNYWQSKRMKEEGYQEAVNDLCRHLKQPPVYATGSGAQAIGWNVL